MPPPHRTALQNKSKPSLRKGYGGDPYNDMVNSCTFDVSDADDPPANADIADSGGFSADGRRLGLTGHMMSLLILFPMSLTPMLSAMVFV